MQTAKQDSSAVARLVSQIRRLFPERQVLIRSGGRVRFAPLSTGRQVMAAAAVLAFLGWTTFTTGAWLSSQATISAKQSELEHAQAEVQSVRDTYQQAYGRLEEYQALFASVTCEVETIQGSLMQLADRAQGKRRPTAVDACAGKAEPTRVLPVSLHGGPTTAIVGTMPEREDLKTRIQRLQVSVEQLKASHANFLRRTSDLASERIGELEQTLHKVGLSPDTVMRRGFGQGGPFLPASLALPVVETPALAELVSLNGTIDRLDMLTQAMHSLPVASPLGGEYEVTSPFGTRNDPINNLTGIHEGVDLGAPMGTPVAATANGTVIFAGWRDRYGLLVEIEHGMGLTTRYGHLSRVLVREGQQVERQTAIGLLGNTGRSTGPHLHYEVRVHGQPRNPTMFFRAGKNVLASN